MDKKMLILYRSKVSSKRLIKTDTNNLKSGAASCFINELSNPPYAVLFYDTFLCI